MKTSIRVALFTAATFCTVASIAQETVALEEIVVTASKREQTLSDIPSAVSVTTADTLDKAHISDILDLHTAVPSLRTSQPGSKFRRAQSVMACEVNPLS